MRRRPSLTILRIALAVVALLLVATGCGADDDQGATTAPLSAEWAEVEQAAEGQTVRWWLFGGDARINRYVERVVVPAADEAGVTLERVPIADTAEAVQRVLAEREAGRTDGGAVDLIWINGENFALGKEAGLWLQDWVRSLPNSRFVDLEDPALASDFGVPVDGQEAPWSRAAFVFAHDPARVPDPPRSVAELLEYARANPGRVTYPAPPDFTGSAFVRLAVQELGADRAIEALADVAPDLFEGGRNYPKTEAELNRLFGDGQVDIAMSYDPGFVRSAVSGGEFPDTARPFAFARTLQNASFVTIPANAAAPEGAAVVANLLMSPALQRTKADPDVLGVPTVIDVDRLPEDLRAGFAPPADDPFLLGPEELGSPLAELPSEDVAPIERRWQREVLR